MGKEKRTHEGEPSPGVTMWDAGAAGVAGLGMCVVPDGPATGGAGCAVGGTAGVLGRVPSAGVVGRERIFQGHCSKSPR